MAYFSIITPVYNRQELIIPTIESVINQSFADWELILVNDASTDNTKDVLDKYCQSDNRIKVISHDVNKERGFARNNGIKNSNAEYICFLDSDDLFDVTHLQNFYNYIEKNKHPVALMFSNTYLISDIHNSSNRTKKTAPQYNHNSRFAYILHYTFNPTRVCIHKDILNEYQFDPKIPGLEDLDLWLHIALKYPIFYLPEYTSMYLVHNESYSTGDKNRFKKELKNFKYIFAKKQFEGILPNNEKNRLLSMCHFHLTESYEYNNEKTNLYKSIIKSFILCPKGYNGKTNKILLVRFLYNLPFLGVIIKRIKNK